MRELSNLWDGVERIVSADRVEAGRRLERVETELRATAEAERRALAREAREIRTRARRSGRAAGYRAGLKEAGRAFAAERRRWASLEAALSEALEAAVAAMAAELPEPALLRRQLRKCMAGLHEPARVKVHANAITAVRLAELWNACAGDIPLDVAVADYLKDGQFVMETETHIVEGSVEREMRSFCAGLREAVGDA
jgi:flagellar biosynthesis/type III secretory pathway protein FliH